MNVFDIIGPVMIGPSSSHTAGAARLGWAARNILGERVVRAEIELFGSFAQTYRGHGTDKALVAGLLGMTPDDENIRRSLELARQAGLAYTFRTGRSPGVHPNTVRLRLLGENGAEAVLQGASTGGGAVLVDRINGMDVSFTGQRDTILVLHHDRAGTIAAVTNFIADCGVNIGSFRLARPQKGGRAMMTIEVDSGIPDTLIPRLLELPQVIDAVHFRSF